MEFSGIFFLLYFLPAVLILYFLSPAKYRNFVLLASGMFFYAWGEPLCLFVMLILSVLNYIFGRKLYSTDSTKKKNVLLTFSILINICICLFFKYANRFGGFFAYIDIKMPLGLSFFILHSISFLVDTYRGKVIKKPSVANLGAYLFMFPISFAGPILKYNQMEKQLISRYETIESFSEGIMRFTVGLAKKVLLADNLLLLWQSIYSVNLQTISVVSSWLGIIAILMGLYFYLSGYSDMAIGLGKMFGINLGENFNYPVFSGSVTEFFSRWYISLTSYFKEYIFAPICKENGKTFKIILATVLSCLLAGIWYDGNTNFIVMGLYFALLICLEKTIFSKIKLPKGLKKLLALLFVVLGAVFFATNSLTDAFLYFKAMFGIGNISAANGSFLYYITSYGVLLAVSIFALFPFGKKFATRYLSKTMSYVKIPVLIALIYCMAYIVA